MKHPGFLTILLLPIVLCAQLPPSPDSAHLVQLNQLIDELVVEQNAAGVEGHYADDFVFSHGSGRIEGKARWMRTVGRTQ